MSRKRRDPAKPKQQPRPTAPTPTCPKCGAPTERPKGDKEIGNFMIMPCQLIGAGSECVFCRPCRAHYHLPRAPQSPSAARASEAE